MSATKFYVQTGVLYGALTLLLFAPNLSAFSTHIWNHPKGNGLKHARNLWEGMESIAERGYPTSEVTWTNHPDGGRLFTLEAGFQYMGMPFRPFLNLVAVHNLLYLIVVFLAAWSAMLLAREFTGDGAAAVAAGAIYAYATTSLAFPVVSGVTETAFLFPLPLVTLYALRSIYQRSWTSPVLAATFFLLQGLTCWSYGIGAAIILTALFVLVGLTAVGDWAHGNRLMRGARIDRALLARIALFAGVSALIALPLYLAAKSTVVGQAAIYDRSLTIFPGLDSSPADNAAQVSFAIVDFVLPGSRGLHAEAWLDLLFRSPFVGFVALLLAAVGLWKGAKGTRTVGLLALLFAVLSLGARVPLWPGESAPIVTNPIYGIFWYVFPAFNVNRHSPDRFAMVFQMFVAVMSASGLAYAMTRWKLAGLRRWLVGAGVAALFLLETVVVSPLPWPLPQADARPQEASLWLRNHGTPGALLDLPACHANTLLFRGDIYLQQIYHQRPIAYNILSVSKSVGRNHFFNRVADGAFAPPPSDPLVAHCDHAAELAEMGFAYIVYRPDLNSHRREAVEPALQACLGQPLVVGNTWLYSFDDVSTGRPVPPVPASARGTHSPPRP